MLNVLLTKLIRGFKFFFNKVIQNLNVLLIAKFIEYQL